MMDYDAKPKRKREEIPGWGDVLLEIVASIGRGGWSVLRWGWRGITGAARWMGRWTWRAVVWSAGLAWALTVWTVLLPWRVLKAVWRWWNGPEPYFESERERDIYRRIRRRFRRRNRLRLHGAFYLLVNGYLWFGWYQSRFFMMPGVIWSYFFVSGVLTVVLLFHYLYVRSREAEEQAIEEAIERERAWQSQQMDEVRYLRLSDDGELLDDDYIEEEIKRKRR